LNKKKFELTDADCKQIARDIIQKLKQEREEKRKAFWRNRL